MERRARRRRLRKQSGQDRAFDNLSLCENLSVSRETRQAYKDAADEFAAWVAAKRLKVHPVDALDDAMTAYIDHLLLQGEEPHQAKYALFGVVKSGMVKSEDSLPRARQAIAGFSGQSPSVMREPIPVEAAALMAEHLVDVADLDPMAGLAACAMVLSFDLYLRPSEVIELTKEAVVPPQGTQYPKWKWAVIVAPSGSINPAKNREFDDTALASVNDAHRDFVGPLLDVLRRQADPKQRVLDPLTLPVYEKYFRNAAQATNLAHLNATPRSVRHGGPSHDAYHGLLDLKQIMQRGRWKALSSARRYEKKGMLQRQLAKMTAEQRDKGNDLLTKHILGQIIIGTVYSLRRLRKADMVPAAPTQANCLGGDCRGHRKRKA